MERILDEIIAPLAAQAPVLVIVMDGMSVAVCRELVADITRQDWMALCEQEREANRPGLAALPSITEVSRTSLLCGQLRPGNATVEKDGFAEHPGLRAHCRSGSMPILFHKPSLQEADDTSLAAEVRGEIAAAHRRVVGVVVNAVDDHPFTFGELTMTSARGQSYGSPVGNDGSFYFENLPPGAYAATVETRDSRCTFTLEIPVSTDTVIKLGSVRCQGSSGR